MPQDVKEIIKDPDFLGLPPEEKAKVLRAVDATFAALPEVKQNKVVNELGSRQAPPEKPGPWQRANTPMVSPEKFTGISKERMDYEMQPYEGESPLHAGLRVGSLGVVRSVGNLMSSMTSPVSAAMTAASLVGGPIPKAVQGVAGAVFGTEGAKQAITQAITPQQPGETQADALERRLMGGAQAAGGAAAVAEPLGQAGRALADRASNRLHEKATKQYQQALQPTKEGTKFLMEKRTQEMLDRKITAQSPRALAARAKMEASAYTEKLNDIYDSLPAERSSPTASTIEALDQYKQQFQDRIPITQEQALSIDRAGGKIEVRDMPDGSQQITKVIDLDKNAIAAADAMQETIREYGDTISPRSMRKARTAFDKIVARAGGYEGKKLVEGSVVEVKKIAANALREQLAKDNPEVVPLNNEINFWLDVQKIAKETAKRRVGQQGSLGVLTKNVGRVVGATAGAQAGVAGAVVGGYIGGEILGKVGAITSSPRWRMVSAVSKNELADALASGNRARVEAQIGFIQRQLAGPRSNQKQLP